MTENLETEKEIVRLILSVLDEQLFKMNFDKKYLNKVKVHKILYNAIEELNLDLTRSWYKRGCYVWSCQGLDSQFLQTGFNTVTTNFPLPKNEIIRAINKSLQKYQILFTRLYTYIEELYKRDAPKEFQEIYTSNLEFKKKYKEFIEEIKGTFKVSLKTFLETPEVTSEYVSHAITKLHSALNSVKPVMDIIIDYTMLFEELLIGVEEKVKNDKLQPKHVEFIEKMFEYYDDKVWELPAKIITEKTIKGTNKEVILKWLNKKFSNLVKEVELKKEKFENEALEMDLFPSESYLAEKINIDTAKTYLEFMANNV